MSMRQILYISQNYRTQTLDLPLNRIERVENARRPRDTGVGFTVRDLKQLIIRNELRLNSLSSQPTLAQLLQHQNLREEDHTLCLCDTLTDNFRLILCNKELKDTERITNLKLNYTFHFKVRIVGGKGGFGATLRSQKPKHPMTMNFDACRDLSGRRLRHVNAQQQLDEWKQKQEEEDKKIEEELENYDESEKQMRAAIHANTYKIDQRYKAQVENASTNISNGIILGKKNLKRRHQDFKQLQKERDDKFSMGEKDLGGMNTLTSDMHQKDVAFEDCENLFYQNNKRKMKRFKIAEDVEKAFKDDHDEDAGDLKDSLILPPKESVLENPPVFEQKNIVKDTQNDIVMEKDIEAIVKQDKVDDEIVTTEEEELQSVLSTLANIESVSTLQTALNQDQIKDALCLFGLKAGGRPEERADRLFMIKPLIEKIDQAPQSEKSKVTYTYDLSSLPKKLFGKKKN